MLRLVCAWVVVNGLLLAPMWVAAVVADAPTVPRLSIEATLIVGGMALLPRSRWSQILAWAVAGTVTLLVAASFGDLLFRVSLGRPLNLSLDLYLLSAIYRLAVGNAGLARTLVGVGATGLMVCGAVLGTAWLVTPAHRTDDRPFWQRPLSRLAGGMIACALFFGLLGFGVDSVRSRFVTPSISLLRDQAALSWAKRAEREAFASELRSQPNNYASVPGLFSALGGRNVVVAYIESYGMAAFDDPDFATVIRPRMEEAQERLGTAGLEMATGQLISPTVGGQSWYAHGTMLSGLWLENQLRYELLLASERETLVDDFRGAGYRTTTVMPAITTGWPEAIRLGFDDVYTAQNIPYAGPPFYWVTMPDQFTWSFVGRLLGEATSPLFVEVGMVSSHAPWTPVVPLLEWDELGDGRIFEPYREDGYPPEEMWWDVETLRVSYARSLDYSLRVMAEFAARLSDETLLIVVGDHQAAPWVTGASSPNVPIHVIAHDPALVEPFLDWGFRPGATPSLGSSVRRMSEFRPWFVGAFSGGG